MLVSVLRRPRLETLFAIIVILAAAALLFRGILFTPTSERFPWSSDAPGHLLKIEFLRSEIADGNIYPKLFPAWYDGVQLLRYYPPLPYYIGAGIFWLTDDIFLTNNLLIFGAALLGGLSFLLYRRWLGLPIAVAAGVLFMALPDNIRVAMAEGNLPRAVATAMLPATFYLFMAILMDGPTRLRFVGLSLLIILIVLSHAMMAAIFIACLAFTALAYTVLGRPRPRSLFVAMAGLSIGLLLSGWWLLPSLTGGITELNSTATAEALASFSPGTLFNSMLRYENKEVFYLGVSLVAGIVIAILFWPRLTRLSRTLVVVAIFTMLIASTLVNPVYRTVPLNHLMWPLRFMSFAGFVALVAIVCCSRDLLRGTQGWQALGLVPLLLLAIDAYPSRTLIFARPLPTELESVAQEIRSRPGWRVATLDFSRLGSSASYMLTAVGKRDQVFGWAYQGSGIADSLSNINFALGNGYSAYAVDRLREMGTDYVVKLETAGIRPGIDDALTEAGFLQVRNNGGITLYYRLNDGPRAYVAEYPILGIGKGAQLTSLVFPKIAVGGSLKVDDYHLDYLSHFQALFLSGFSWNSQSDAEKLVRSYMANGGKVVVDLTGVPNNVLSGRPEFMGVVGEPIAFYGPPQLTVEGQPLTMAPFDPQYMPWNTFTPQKVDGSVADYSYLEEDATALAYRDLPEGRIWFVGMNIPFHSALTQDKAAISLLESVLPAKHSAVPARSTISLENFQQSSRDYRFRYTLEQERFVVLPIAHHDGTTVSVDGKRIESTALNDLTYIKVPAGTHEVVITFEATAIYWMGILVSFVGLALFIAVSVWLPKRRQIDSTQVEES